MSRIRSLHPDQWPEGAKSASLNYHFYVVQEGENGPVKVGIARNAFWRRGDLQTGNPRRIYMRAIYECDSRGEAILLEAAALGKFADQRILGEWLSASLADVVEFTEQQVSKCPE